MKLSHSFCLPASESGLQPRCHTLSLNHVFFFFAFLNKFFKLVVQVLHFPACSLATCCSVAHSSTGRWTFDMKSVCLMQAVGIEPSCASLHVCLVPFAPGEEVPHHLCSELPRPEVVACEVPCARDCVVSEWSPWSPCSHSCSSKNAEGSQSRSRSIVALPAEGEC